MSILKPGINCMGIYAADASGAIVDAADYYRWVYHAARGARRYLLFTGWQFDTEVRLLRGDDREGVAGEVRFLHFLEHLCRERPELQIYILAWDFSLWFSLEREWFQHIIFNWTTNERIHFRFDNRHAFGATHHQKLVVVDGLLAFVGGMDICSDRWDDRRHLPHNPERHDTNGPFGSYHDIQSYHTGPVVRELTEIFLQRWLNAGGEPLCLEPAEGTVHLDHRAALPLAATQVAISRTQALNFTPHQNEILEIRTLYMDAIVAANRLIYLENQYFSSRAIFESLIARMTDQDRSRLQIVMILPDRLPFAEELFLGRTQMKMVRTLRQIAREHGHRLGIYSSTCQIDGTRRMTFIHSKLLLVDDRFLSIGSANITNRSMGLDTELNVSWEDESGGAGSMGNSIRRLRGTLLAEHAGLLGSDREKSFEEKERLVDYLDRLAADPAIRLNRYESDPALENTPFGDALDPISCMVDPTEPDFEELNTSRTGTFARGIHQLSQWVNSLL